MSRSLVYSDSDVATLICRVRPAPATWQLSAEEWANRDPWADECHMRAAARQRHFTGAEDAPIETVREYLKGTV